MGYFAKPLWELPVIRLIFVVFVILAILLVAVWAYARWWLRRVVIETPRAQVTLQRVLEPPGTRATVVMRGTNRIFRVIHLMVSRQVVEGLHLLPPDGFIAAHGDSDEVIWKPLRELKLAPNRPVTLEFPGGSSDDPGTVRVWAEASLGHGGTGVSIPILVGEGRAEYLRAQNLRSELLARAAERGVLPRELPEWEELAALEVRIRGTA